jgi:hypothetical protein
VKKLCIFEAFVAIAKNAAKADTGSISLSGFY